MPENNGLSDPTGYRIEWQQQAPAILLQPDFAQEWQTLESHADVTFFLSWQWISTWLGLCNEPLRLARIYYNNVLVGLGLFTWSTEIRHRFLRSRVLRLHRTGLPEWDQIWIEYNQLLLDRAHQKTAPAALITFLLSRDDWDELELGASDSQVLQNYQTTPLIPVEHWSSPCYGVDLNALRQTGKHYRDSLSRNTRYQINRSEKRYQQSGQLTFACVQDPKAIAEWWPQLAALHQQRWGMTPTLSGFANPAFVQFHQRLIAQCAPLHLVEFCTLFLGDLMLGCLYNFVYRGRVYFYASGLRQEADAQLKPGLLLHAMAIQHYLERGLEFYDFMGGDARYKQSLASRSVELKLVSLQRPRLSLKLEQFARRLKHWRPDTPQQDAPNAD